MAKRNNKKSRKSSSPREIGLGIDLGTFHRLANVSIDSFHDQTQHIYDKLLQCKSQLIDMHPGQDGYTELEADFQRHAWYLGFNLSSAKHRFVYDLLLNGQSKLRVGVGTSNRTREHNILMPYVDQMFLLKAVVEAYDQAGGHHEPVAEFLDLQAEQMASSCYRHANPG